MAVEKLVLRPGINRQASRTLLEGGYYNASLVRFRSGLPEKFGGWSKYITTLLDGVVRAVRAYYPLRGDLIVAVGSHTHFYLLLGGSVTDITPVDRIQAASSVATTNGSASVLITFGAVHDAAVGDFLTLDTITGTSRAPSGLTVGGITFSGDYVITAVPSTTTLRITAANVASSTASGGAAQPVTFFLPSGAINNTPGLGWGAGPWGTGHGWGTPSPVAAITLPLRAWSMDNWGQAIVATPGQGKLYYWVPSGSGGLTDRLGVVTNGTAANGPPLRIGSVVVALPERHVMLLGTSDLNSASNYDPLLVRWSDVEDYTSYRATSLNSAGSFRLTSGSVIHAGYMLNMQGLIWTDVDVWTVRFIGLPYVYRFDLAGRNCGLISSKGFAQMGGAVYWMSGSGFYRFRGGAVEPLDCTLWDDVYNNLDQAQQTKVYAATNATFGEVIWFYPTASGECDRYICFNVQQNIWYGGVLSRTAWLDKDPLTTPIAISYSGGMSQVYAHENGTDADGVAMGEFIDTGWIDIADGQDITFLSELIPDFAVLSVGGSVEMTVSAVKYPARDGTPSETMVRGPYMITRATAHITPRVRGRQVALRIGNSGVGTAWRLGATRVRVQPDGQN